MQQTNNLKQFGFNTPHLPAEVRLHKYRRLNPLADTNRSLSYDQQNESIIAKNDALKYIIVECNAHIRLCKQIGHKIHGDSTAWEHICEIQSSLERIKDNCEIALTQ